MKRNPIKKVLILVSILAIPGFLFFYLLPRFAKNRYKSLPIYGEKIVAKTFHSVRGEQVPDTIYHQVPDFDLLNQNNERVNWQTFKNKLVVVNLFYAGAKNQLANNYIKQLSDSYAKKPLLRFVSLSVNPDDVDSLKTVADSFKAQSTQWNFLGGDTSQTYPLIRKGLLMDVLAVNRDGHPNYIFSNKLLLIDNLHRIRGIYDVDNQESTDRLEDEIKVLIAEYLRNIKDGR